MDKPRRPFVLGTFTVTNDFFNASKLSGNDENDVIEDRLLKIEESLDLKSGSLIIYYAEQLKDYCKYWYTDGKNTEYIVSFEDKIYSFSKYSNRKFSPKNN